MLLHKIKGLCKEKNISLSDLEARLNLSNKGIYRWEHSMPSADKVLKAAEILGTTVEDLLSEENGDFIN